MLKFMAPGSGVKALRVVPYCQSLKSQHEMEIKDTICGALKCISSPTLVYNSSNASFTDLTSCNHMLHQLQCHSVKACIPNNGGKLKTVCTDNLCLTDHACPELTVTSDQRMVVQSKDDKCMDCRKYDDLKSRLQVNILKEGVDNAAECSRVARVVEIDFQCGIVKFHRGDKIHSLGRGFAES
uniref:Uncharacterized protein n=1 Tax=Magallana gigas TaxID=29159 RepID=K1S5A4_MAGGI